MFMMMMMMITWPVSALQYIEGRPSWVL